MELRLLGPLQVLRGGDEVPLRGAKQRRLLALLALHNGQAVSSERLIDLLWGEDPPSKPANALQAQVSQLRRALGDDCIVTNGPGYSLNVRAEQVDAERFERMVTRGRRLLEDGDPRAAAAELGDALALWRGPAYMEFSDDEVARAAAARLDELRVGALTSLMEARLDLGQHAEVVAELERATAEHPLHERVWALLMIALYRSGRQADALRAYGVARQLLLEELGLDPGDELRDLESRVLGQDPQLDWVPPAEERRVPTSATRGTAGHGLPERLTTFVGRAQEMVAVRDLLRASRLVTIVGPGGMGKTRLALEVASALESELADGVVLVELASLLEPDGVVVAVGAAVGATEADAAARTVGGGARGPREQLVDHLRSASILIVLDNCEHLLQPVAELAEQLLTASPGLRILATSREALLVPGESLLPLGPLDRADGVRLLAERAKAVRPDFVLDEATLPVIHDVVERLDALPLAIELAAARCRALPVAEIAARLDDRFRLLTGGARTAVPRQQTLRAVVDWSYDLLFEDERLLLQRLAVFAGGCTLSAAEAVCADARVPASDVLDVLGRLVDKSLVVCEQSAAPETTRYRMLQTLWHYARERLVEQDEAAELHRRHAAWIVDLVRASERLLRGSGAVEARRVLEAELDNARLALDWCAEHGDGDGALSLAVGYAWVFFLRGEWVEGMRWTDQALRCSKDAPEELVGLGVCWSAYLGALSQGRADALDQCGAGLARLRAAGDAWRLADGLLLYASIAGRRAEARLVGPVIDEAEQLCDRIGYGWGRATAALLRAAAALNFGDVELAARAAEASVAHFTDVGDPWGMVEALGYEGAIAQLHGDYERAVEANEQRLPLARSLGLTAYEAMAMMNLANLRTLLGDPAGAEQILVDALELTPSTWATAFGLNGRGQAARRRGDPERALRYHREADDIYAAAGGLPGQAASLAFIAWCHVDLGDAPGACDAVRRSLATSEATGDPQTRAFALEAMAGAALIEEDGCRAARLLGAAAALRDAAGLPLAGPERVDIEEIERRARLLVGDAAFARAREEGAAAPDQIADLLATAG